MVHDLGKETNKESKTEMDTNTVNASAYYLLICADGHVNEKELLLGNTMIAVEGLDGKKFEDAIGTFKSQDKKQIYNLCISGLKKMEKKKQIRCVSWLSLIANSDGFMDTKEWDLIYKIYNTELGISLNEILKTQKEIKGAIGKCSVTCDVTLHYSLN
ncbi:MAG TPA: hypothetical protein PLJ60_11635 [Chryseolinea sp.]|nr:hypothetical protein [Chryseolinea sp.]